MLFRELAEMEEAPLSGDLDHRGIRDPAQQLAAQFGESAHGEKTSGADAKRLAKGVLQPCQAGAGRDAQIVDAHCGAAVAFEKFLGAANHPPAFTG